MFAGRGRQRNPTHSRFDEFSRDGDRSGVGCPLPNDPHDMVVEFWGSLCLPEAGLPGSLLRPVSVGKIIRIGPKPTAPKAGQVLGIFLAVLSAKTGVGRLAKRPSVSHREAQGPLKPSNRELK
jgi:hypothetical protein